MSSSLRVRVFLFLAITLVVLTGCTRQFSAQGGWSGTALGTDTLYLGSREGKLLALSSETGLVEWSFPPEEGEGLTAIYSTPVYADGHVYLGAYNGKVYRLDPPTESPAAPGSWEFPTAGPIVGGVAVADGLVLVGSSDRRLYALDLETGTEKWSFPTEGMVWSTPTVADGIVYFGSMDHRVYALRLNGTEVWRFEAGGAVVSAPLVVGGRAYVGTLDRRLYALDASSGIPVWEFTGAGNWFWATPAADGRRVYAANMDGFLYALDASSGIPVWRFDTGGAVMVPPLVTDDGVLVASDAGRVYFLNLDGQLRFAPGFYDVGDSIRAPMTLRDDILYLNAMNETVVAVDARRGNRLWSSSTQGN